jgi:membrane-associated phospholipid phosphatase
VRRFKGQVEASLASRYVQTMSVVLCLPIVALLVDHEVHTLSPSWKMHPLDLFIGALNPIGYGVTLLMVTMALCALGWCAKRPRLCEAACFASWTFVIAGVFEFSLKHLVGRPRPDSAAMSMLPIGPSLTTGFDSFPSGHATSVFAVACAFAYFYPRLRWPLYLLAICISLGRLYLDRHYVSDILGGALIGIVVTTVLLQYKDSLPSFPSFRPSRTEG